MHAALLEIADDCLVLGHRLSEWCGHAPMLEEDLALPNMALDLIGTARGLYEHAGVLEDKGRGENDLAYFRGEREFVNCLLVERPNGDFAQTMLRQLYFAAFMEPFWRAAMASTDPVVAGIAGKAVKEVAYHIRHAGEWVIRLGDGTEESHRRMQAALEALWPWTGEAFLGDATDAAMAAAGIAPAPESLRPAWDETVNAVLAEATLTRPAGEFAHRGGRQGRHTEHLGHLLASMQWLQRAYPGARW